MMLVVIEHLLELEIVLVEELVILKVVHCLVRLLLVHHLLVMVVIVPLIATLCRRACHNWHCTRLCLVLISHIVLLVVLVRLLLLSGVRCRLVIVDEFVQHHCSGVIATTACRVCVVLSSSRAVVVEVVVF